MPQPSTSLSTRAKVGAVAALVVVVGGLAAIGSQVGPSPTPTTVPPVTTVANGCKPDPAKDIAKVRVGGTWNGQNLCYNVAGESITRAITVENAMFDDRTPPPSVKSKHGLGMAPIILVKQTNGVTLKNLVLNGSDPNFTFKSGAVGQAGISVRSSSDLTITNVATNDTWGDGLTLFLAAGKKGGPDLNVTVNGLTVTQAGRDGISPAFVQDSTFTDVNIGSAKDNALDFESDLPKVESGNLTFTNLVAHGGINVIQGLKGDALTGYVKFVNTVSTGKFHLSSTNSQVSYQGQFICSRNAPGACVTVTHGTLTISPLTGQTQFAYSPGTSKAGQAFSLATPPGVIVTN